MLAQQAGDYIFRQLLRCGGRKGGDYVLMLAYVAIYGIGPGCLRSRVSFKDSGDYYMAVAPFMNSKTMSTA